MLEACGWHDDVQGDSLRVQAKVHRISPQIADSVVCAPWKPQVGGNAEREGRASGKTKTLATSSRNVQAEVCVIPTLNADPWRSLRVFCCLACCCHARCAIQIVLVHAQSSGLSTTFCDPNCCVFDGLSFNINNVNATMRSSQQTLQQLSQQCWNAAAAHKSIRSCHHHQLARPRRKIHKEIASQRAAQSFLNQCSMSNVSAVML